MSDAPIVGSVAFELRATKARLKGDMEEARRELEAEAKKASDSVGQALGDGAKKGAKAAAESLKEPKAAAAETGQTIRNTMEKAGKAIGDEVAKGSKKAREELDALAKKAREVQAIKPPNPTIPTEATHRLVTNPVNGAQGWVALDLARNSDAVAKRMDESAKKSKDLVDALKDIEPAAESAAGGLGSFDKKALVTTASMAALVAGAFVVIKGLYDVGRASFQMASDIGKAADRIGIGSEALQEFRYVAQKTGEDASAVDNALEGFGKRFTQAAAGLSREASDAFAALGFSQEQLRSFETVEEALDATIDRIGELSSASDRAAIADKLGLGPLVTALRDGEDKVTRLRDEARALGFVMDDTFVQKGMDAQKELDTLSQIIGIQMAEAFVSLSDEVIAFTGYIASALKGLNDFIAGARNYSQKVDDVYGQGTVAAALRGDQWTAARNVTRSVASGRAGRVAAALRNPQVDQDDPFLLRQQMSAADAERRPQRPDRDPRTRLTPVDRSRGRADTSAREAQRAAEREARRAERVQEEINRAKVQALQIAQDDLRSVQQLYDLRRQELQARREGEDTELRSRLARKDLTQAEFDQLTSQLAINRGLEDRVAASLLGRDLEDERLASERLLANLTADLISLQSGSARTAQERLKLERELLEITQRQRRESLRIELERNTSMSAADKQSAMNRLGQIESAERDAVARRNMGPLDAWRDRSLQSAAEVREAYEAIASRGLDSINDALTDAIMNTRSWGDAFSAVAKQILADLVSISVRQGIVQPLANLLFPQQGGSGGSQSGGIFSALGNIFSRLPKFAMGGSILPGGSGGIDSQLVAFWKSPSERVDIYDPSSARGGARLAPAGGAYFDLRGAVMTKDLLRQMNQIGHVQGDRAYGRSMADAPKLTMSQTAKQQSSAVGRKRR